MKSAVLWLSVAAFGLVGCAHDRDYRYGVAEHPADRSVVVDRTDRGYVRDYDRPYSSSAFQDNMEPRLRGKHAEALGWRTESFVRQNTYR